MWESRKVAHKPVVGIVAAVAVVDKHVARALDLCFSILRVNARELCFGNQTDLRNNNMMASNEATKSPELATDLTQSSSTVFQIYPIAITNFDNGEDVFFASASSCGACGSCGSGNCTNCSS